MTSELVAPFRTQIRAQISHLTAGDEKEAEAIKQTLAWIDSGVELCRTRKPNVPDKHLVSYAVLIDGDHVLLVDHINAQLWLPTGGHVEPLEQPVIAASRELEEELGITATPKQSTPVLLTSTQTVGVGPIHTDVSLWFVFEGDRRQPLNFDLSEFTQACWFHIDEIPLARSDPEMGRFIDKYFQRSRVT